MSSIRSIVRSLGRLSSRWLDRNYSFRKKAVTRLVDRSGFSEAMAQAMLDVLFRELTEAKLWGMLESELRDPLALDGFRRDARNRRWTRAQGPGTIVHIFSANIPNAAILSFVLGLLVKSRNVGKLSKRDPGFLDIYLRSLKKADRALWKTNRLIREGELSVWLKRAGLVVAYGNDGTLSEIRARLPGAVPFVGYGHRFSAGLYYKEALTPSLAVRAARDVWMCAQRGCLSPTTLYVQKGGKMSPRDFAAALSAGMRKLHFSAGVLLRTDGKNLAPVLSVATPIVCVKSFKEDRKVFAALEPYRRYLQCVALECPSKQRQKIAEQLSFLGVNRICFAGQMQLPPVTWHHDGRHNLANWIYWTDLEK